MVRLKLFAIFIVLYCFANIIVDLKLYSCVGPAVVVSDVYANKIKVATDLFIKPINFPEPKYRIKITQCYNAWASYQDNTIVISEPVIKNFSTKELAGILGHELAHIQADKQKVSVADQIDNHWKIDVMGAELTSKEVMIKKLNRMLEENDNLFKTNGFLMYYFPLSYLEHTLSRDDFMFRIKKVNDHFK